MPTVKAIPEDDLSSRLAGGTFSLHVGPYIYRLQSNLSRITTGILALYPDFKLAADQDFIDFNIFIGYRSFFSRLRGNADFLFDNQRTFGAIPRMQAYAFLEWGMNWCVSLHTNEYLKLHAAAVAKEGAAIIMPGIPGAGKSTLCAALGLSGWRILSDEHALIPPGTADVMPLCRPVSLKNESIPLIRAFDPSAILGPVSEDTHKGVVAHMKADLTPDSHDPAALPARIMIFPKFSKDEPQRLVPRRRALSFIIAAYHSFNYSLMGEQGFAAMKTLVDSVACYDLIYRDLDWAVHTVDDLHSRTTS